MKESNETKLILNELREMKTEILAAIRAYARSPMANYPPDQSSNEEHPPESSSTEQPSPEASPCSISPGEMTK